jgi:hypothetical protein
MKALRKYKFWTIEKPDRLEIPLRFKYYKSINNLKFSNN